MAWFWHGLCQGGHVRVDAGDAARVWSRQALFAVAGTLLVWLAARVVFFEGFRGSDDFHYMRFALFWDRFPADQWEARILYNGFLRASFALFGFGQVSGALPGLACSLSVLLGSLWLSWRYHHSAKILWLVGLFVSTLPAEVLCTTPNARVLAAGIFCIGAVVLLGGTKWLSAVVAGLFLGLAFTAHAMALFPLVFLLGVALVLRYRRAGDVGLAAIVALAAFAVADLGVYVLWTGDPLYEFRMASLVATSGWAGDPLYTRLFTEDGSFSPFFYWRGLRELMASQAFGFVPLAAILGGVLTWKRRGQLTHVLTLTFVMTWFWISYGSVTPTRYTPFPLTTAYMGPLGFMLAWVAANVLLPVEKRAIQVGLAGLLVGANLAVLSLAGSWGQSVKISMISSPTSINALNSVSRPMTQPSRSCAS